MKNLFFFTIFSLLFISFDLSAEGIKIFQLKDGSSIRGELVSFAQGVYVVNTQTMGEIRLQEANVASITDESVQSTVNLPLNLQGVANAQPSLGNQMQQVQQKLMANPQLNQQMQGLAQDPEIMQLLSDPQLIQEMTAAMNGGDTQAIQQNPKVQQLMQNQKMQDLIQNLQASDLNLTPPQNQNSTGQ